MGAWEIILIIACALLVIGVVVYRIIKRRKGETDCECGCDCSYCSARCKAKKPRDK